MSASNSYDPGALRKVNNLSDVVTPATARTNLGLGTAAVADTGSTSGTLPVFGAGGALVVPGLATIGGSSVTSQHLIEGASVGADVLLIKGGVDTHSAVSLLDSNSGVVETFGYGNSGIVGLYSLRCFIGISNGGGGVNPPKDFIISQEGALSAQPFNTYPRMFFDGAQGDIYLYRLTPTSDPVTTANSTVALKVDAALGIVNLYVRQSGNATGTGTITGTSGYTVTGTSTLFTTELEVGSSIFANGASAIVRSIASDTSLTVADSIFPSLGTGQAFTYQDPGAQFFGNGLTEFTHILTNGNPWIQSTSSPKIWLNRVSGRCWNFSVGTSNAFLIHDATGNADPMSIASGAADSSLTLAASGAVSARGSATNDSAAAGFIGQVISALVAVGAPVSLTSTTAADITSISLTAGDWDVEGNVNFLGTAATITQLTASIGSTTATLATDGSEVYSGLQTITASATDSVTMPTKRISVAGTTTIYLVGRAVFAAGTVGGFGSIVARRRR